jgi:hypothetical protein
MQQLRARPEVVVRLVKVGLHVLLRALLLFDNRREDGKYLAGEGRCVMYNI